MIIPLRVRRTMSYPYDMVRRRDSTYSEMVHGTYCSFFLLPGQCCIAPKPSRAKSVHMRLAQQPCHPERNEVEPKGAQNDTPAQGHSIKCTNVVSPT